MEIETKVISVDIIKPSSPTPKSLQKYQLSFLDQCMHTSFIPLVYFYSSNPKFSNSEKSKQLKKSLSEILSIYYPLAGRLAGNLYVDCNDAGAPFSEAEADCDVSQIITNPNPNNLKNFLPHNTDDQFQDLCMAVRATYFLCGGISVGILLSHKIADGMSSLLFVNTWSAVSINGGSGGGGVPLPKFDSTAYFPPLDILGGLKHTTGLVEEEIATRIFTLPASQIAALQERYTGAGGRRPSRVEALSAFIWTRFASATGIRSDPGKICMLYNAANLRSWDDLSLSEYHFGNLIVGSRTEVAAGNGGVEVLQKMREASKAFGADYAARLKEREMQLKELMALTRANEVEVRFFFSSMCRFPFYEADFGWGRPDWVGYDGVPYKNVASFMDTKSDGGIDALIQLTKQDMEKFEARLAEDRSNL